MGEESISSQKEKEKMKKINLKPEGFEKSATLILESFQSFGNVMGCCWAIDVTLPTGQYHQYKKLFYEYFAPSRHNSWLYIHFWTLNAKRPQASLEPRLIALLLCADIVRDENRREHRRMMAAKRRKNK